MPPSPRRAQRPPRPEPRAVPLGTTAMAALAAGIGLLGIAAVWRDPYRLVRAEYRRQARVLRFARRHAVIDDTRWAYVERTAVGPAAPTLVLLHGYTGSKENWFVLARALGRRYRLLAPDLPGWGDSTREADGDYGYAAQADRVASFLQRIGGGPVVLVGHSMGGGIAAVVAARHPQLVSRLALLDASGVEFADNRFGLDVLDGQNPFGVVDRASLERYLGILFHQRASRPPIPWPAGHAVIAHRRREGAFEQSVLDHIGRGADRFLPATAAADIRQPTLLLWGAQDQVIDPSAMALFGARIAHARQVLLDDCGHMSLMEQPKAVAAAIATLVEPGVPP